MKTSIGIGINELPIALVSRFGGGGADIGLLADRPFTNDSTGTGSSATWDAATGTLTLVGDTTTTRGVANFDMANLTDGASYTLSMTVLIVDDPVVANLALDNNKIVGLGTIIQTNIPHTAGAVSYTFTAQAARPFLQFYTGGGTGTWSATVLRVEAS